MAVESAVGHGRARERVRECAHGRICSRRANNRAATHLSIVGVDFGHFD
jgi:hypothetical protein